MGSVTTNKAPKGCKKIAQGDALGTRAPKTSARGLDARAKSKSNPKRRRGRRAPNSVLGKKIWAVITLNEGVTGDLTHAAAMKLAAKNGGYVTTNNAILRCD